MSHLSAKQKTTIYKTYGGAETNTGATGSPIAQMT